MGVGGLEASSQPSSKQQQQQRSMRRSTSLRAARELLNGDSMVEPSRASHTPPPSLFAVRGNQETMMLSGACALPVVVCTSAACYLDRITGANVPSAMRYSSPPTLTHYLHCICLSFSLSF